MMLLTNGCSFTEGYDLPLLTDSWPFALGRLFDIEVENLAVGGGSNDRIYRTTIEYLNVNPVPDLVIIGWTSFFRSELSHSEGIYLRVLPHNCVTEPHRVEIDGEKMHRFWVENLYNEYINYRKWVNYVLHLQDYFDSKKIPYRFFTAIDDNLLDAFLKDSPKALELADKSWQWRDRSRYNPCADIHTEYQELKAMIKRINLDHWIMKNEINMEDYLSSLGYQKDKTGHFMSDGHQRWAESIADETRCLI
jgi:hypothetical protein